MDLTHFMLKVIWGGDPVDGVLFIDKYNLQSGLFLVFQLKFPHQHFIPVPLFFLICSQLLKWDVSEIPVFPIQYIS